MRMAEASATMMALTNIIRGPDRTEEEKNRKEEKDKKISSSTFGEKISPLLFRGPDRTEEEKNRKEEKDKKISSSTFGEKISPLFLRRFMYGSFGGALDGLLIFRSPATR
ncbi:hypothetical protein F8388_000677 [Cannabis sativa]|uniref:Uncharacterized protein n=1 Tax=Cannabis sativa TaxID=3483 RepID=A0A7J6HDT6_CANSA|nr:hypothetical protein F8388_000677 [Cannabis sativa]